MNPYDVEALLGKIIRLLICTGYNPTIFKRTAVEAAIGRFTN